MKRSISAEQIRSVNEGSFWGRVDMSSDCWIWMGAKRSNGYGNCYIPATQTSTSAHRVALVLSGHEVDAAQQVDHLCRNRSCVNPGHLEAVTAQENVLRTQGGYCLRGHVKPPGSSCHECRLLRQRERRAAERTFVRGPGSGSFQRSKTHCPQGHPYDEENTYRTRGGKRMCRECMRSRTRARRAAIESLESDRAAVAEDDPQ